MPDLIESEETGESVQLLPIKVWGIRHLNRCYHLDKVYVKLVNWIEWGKAGNKMIANVGFDDYDRFMDYSQHHFDIERIAKGKETFIPENFKITGPIDSLDYVPIEHKEPEPKEEDADVPEKDDGISDDSSDDSAEKNRKALKALRDKKKGKNKKGKKGKKGKKESSGEEDDDKEENEDKEEEDDEYYDEEDENEDEEEYDEEDYDAEEENEDEE